MATEDRQLRYIATLYCALGTLYGDLLALPEAQAHLETGVTLAYAINSPTVYRVAAGLLASVAVAQGRLDAAQTLLDTALPAGAPVRSKAQRLVACSRVELLLARRQPAEALDWVDPLIASAVIPGGDPQETVIPRLWHLRGEALLALQRPAEAERVLQAAQSAARAQGAPGLRWRICGSLARLYQQQRRREQALASLAAAQEVITALAQTVADETLGRTFVQRATEQLPDLAPPTPRQAVKLTYDGLTDRERQVAVLVAQGKLNREIADVLVISERTVAKHVENILAKLGFTARTQIAVWAVEKGLVD
jgi:DNA-binding NarL/FixJ family response regulator